MSAQQHYVFNCRGYISTDNARAPQSAFSYNTGANTFSISASGNNNVAFQMNTGMDGEYYIDNDETMLLICGENLSATTSHSYVWWLNGFNDGGQISPDRIFSDNTDRVLLWNLKTNTRINSNFDWTKKKVNIGAYGKGLILAIGLTALDSSRPGVVKDFGYYAPWEVAAKHPALMTSLGFDATSLTEAAKAKALVLDASQQEAADAIAEDDYEAAYALYLKARQKADGDDEASHTSSYETTSDGILARLDDEYIRIQFFNDSVVHISKSFDAASGFDSWAVIAEPQMTQITVNESDGIVTLQTAKMRVEYKLSTGKATFFGAKGQQLLAESNHRFVETTDGPFASYTLTQYFQLADDERIYGMGQLQDGQLNRRGTTVKLEQDNRSICIPYFLSSKNYGLYWDNYSPTTFNDSGAETFFRSTGKVIDYYVLCGENSHEVQRSLRNLTGQTELPPLWNFGLYQSKERYASANEVMSVVKKYQDLHIPLDCIVQDWQYWGDNAHWNAMEFLNPDYSNYQEMIDFVHNNNKKLMISIWASFGPSTKQFSELQSKGLLFTSETWPTGAGVKPYNPYNSEARDIYWNYLWNGLVNKGIDAYWMDSTEPDFFGNENDKDNVALPGQTWRSLRNAFPLATVSGVAQHHRSQPELAAKRVSIMTRSGYLGMQRTGAYVWSADINGDWTTLRNQIPAACNLSESGLPYWNSDTGGFFGADVNNPAWRRLYVRWTQFSAFTPMLRFHGTAAPREPWHIGSAGDSRGEYDNLVKYIKLRYSLLPYIYSTAHQVRTDAVGFMQAMPVAYPNDEQTYDIIDQYMFGKNFLVAPIVEDGVIGRNVYLPQGDRWIDFWSGYTFEGGEQPFKAAPMDIIPLYVRAGSILPWGPEVQYSSEKNWDNLELRIYPGADGKFTLYEDELDNYNYEQGQYTEIPITWNEATKTLTFGARRGSFDGMLSERTFNVIVVTPEKGVGDAHSTQFDAIITYNGEETSIVLEAKNFAEPILEECTGHIKNPSFEADGRALTKENPQGWTVNASTAWWGVNQVNSGATGDPQPTEGKYIFGVWDNSVRSASISQTISTLPSGKYRLTVDMHASNRDNSVRLGDQAVFAGNAIGLFREQVQSPGSDDAVPMQTIRVDFLVEHDNDPVTIGVSTANAPTETWFKIDNFRLYSVEESEPTAIETLQRPSSLGGIDEDHWYSISGFRIKHPTHGIYIRNGKKVSLQ